ncbi:MAG: vWA domain-containing protein [Steroidobacteraceae bacterium]
MHSFHFLHPAWLLALPALLGLAGWSAWRGHRDGAWSQLVDAELLPALRLNNDGRRGNSPWPLVGVIWTLAVFALAAPSWQRDQVSAYRAPAAWVLVLDLSASMGAADLAPDRITRARYAISDLLSAARDALVGLIVFAAESHTVAPLTTDVATVRLLLQPLVPGLMPEPGDNLAPALDEAARLLHTRMVHGGQVVVLSDGFADPAKALLAAKRLHQQGAKVDVVGVGTGAGAPLPNGQGQFEHDAQGHTLLARLQTDQLRRVAAAGGGLYVPITALSELIARLQTNPAVSSSRPDAAAQKDVVTWLNGGIWLLPPLLLLAALLARKGWL